MPSPVGRTITRPAVGRANAIRARSFASSGNSSGPTSRVSKPLRKASPPRGLPMRKPRHRVTIKDLPTELLCKIFILCLPPALVRPKRLEAPYLFTAVCRSWRDLAIEMQELWCELFIRCDIETEVNKKKSREGLVGGQHAGGIRNLGSGKGQKPAENSRLRGDAPGAKGPVYFKRFSIMQAVPAWLSRAAKRPLTLVYDFTTNSGSGGPRSVSPGKLLDRVLTPYTSQLRYLCLSMPLGYFRAFRNVTRASVFPMLEFVRLNLPYEPHEQYTDHEGSPGSRIGRREVKDKSISFAHAPRLTYLYLETADPAFGFLSSSLVTHVPYEQLTELSIIEPSLHPSEAVSILSECTNLIRCTLKIGQWEGLPSMSSPIQGWVTLWQLKVLIVSFVGRSTQGLIAPFFEPLVTPVLVKLTVSAPDANDGSFLPALGDMVYRSGSPIKILALMGLRMQMGPLLVFLDQVRHVEKLFVEAPMDGYCYGYPEILIGIAHRNFLRDGGDKEERGDVDRNEFILPNLVEIFVADNVPDEFSDPRTGKLAEYLKIREKINVADVLKDMEVLRALESRCWADSDEGHGGRQMLEIATVKWRNAPIEWCMEKERLVALEYAQQVGEVYPLDIYLPIVPRVL